jgi:molybdate transport system permease protein
LKQIIVTFELATILLLASGLGCRRDDPAAETTAAAKAPGTVLVFAAASTTNALNEIKSQFTKETGIVIETSYAASSALAQQVVHGAKADLFISADAKWADFLEEQNQIARRQDFLGNRLVIVVPLDSKLEIKQLRDMPDSGIKHLALGETQSVPAGIYARQALTKLQLWEPIKDRVVSAADVRQALTYVETGNAEAGIVYATDAAISKKVKVAAEIPEEQTGPVRYPLALLKHGEGSAAAEAFYRYLTSPAACRVFREYGFTISGVTGRDRAGETSGQPIEMPTQGQSWSALRLSLQVTLAAAVCSLPLAIIAGYVLARLSFPGKWIAQVVIDLPLVLPPVVTGYLLLVCFSPNGAIGSLLSRLGIEIAFTWLGAALASAVVSFPLMVRAIRIAFQGVDPRYEMAARSLGASRLGAFFTVALPLARQGLIAGFLLAFARGLGEFGATIMLAGNIEGRTQTIPLAIYAAASTPGGAGETWRLAGLSILLAATTLAASEWLERRRPRDVAA